MSLQTGPISESGNEKTALAAIVAIVMVIPAIIPAAVIAVVYNFFFHIFTGGASWIPYVDEIGKLWFPEMLRGMVVGAIAIWVSRHFFPRSNLEAVRLATFAFWAAILLLMLGFSFSLRGLSLDMIGVVALLTGFGVGLWMTPS